MSWFTFAWPYIGLAAGAGLALLLAGDRLRSDRTVPRTQDLLWFAGAGTLAYIVHQFEEHGIDAAGAPYAFRGSLCATMGFTDAATCAIPYSFITAVNVAAVWLAGPLAMVLGRRRPALALAFFAIPSVNLVAHLGPAIAARAYNPGAVTALLLFLPLSLWTFHVALARYRLGARTVVATVAAGIVLHAVLMGSLQAFLHGLIGEGVLDLIQFLNPLLAGAIVYAAAPRDPGPAGARV